jgi:CheY-like chemotaxis protein
VATKILLADDSMTAQKMGKEILTAAGYEVTAVSNGAAASKKLADKFDVIILDVYMPGYSGLEVCEKVRANMEIAKTPVLLTVGKMEHYEPADTQRVKADGVIVKPFEATDLLAIVKKLSEKSSATPPPPPPKKPDYEKTMIFTAPQIQEFKDQSYAEWKTDAPAEAEPAQAPAAAAFEMTHAEASAPAFAMDMAPSVSSFDETVNIPPVPVASASFDETVGFPPSAPVMEFSTGAAAAPAFELPTTPAPAFEVAAVMPSVDPALEAGPGEAQGYSIPATDPALAQHVEISREEFVTHVSTSVPEPELVTDEAAELAAAAAEIAGTPAPAVDDFDARVANAMSGYETGYETAEAVEAEPEPVVAAPETNLIVEAVNYEARSAEPPVYERTQKITAITEPEPVVAETAPEVVIESAPEPVVEAVAEPTTASVVEQVVEAVAPTIPDSQAPPEGMQDASLVEQMNAAFADLPVETTPHVIEEPAAAPESAATMSAASVTGGQDMELASALAAAIGEQSSTAGAASSSPAASAMDHNTIAQVVSRVMERMLPSVMHEIAKELEAAKK